MRKTDITQELARLLFDYRSGKLIWRDRPSHHFINETEFEKWNKKYPGVEAGAVGPKGYRSIGVTIGGKKLRVLAHRAIWSWHHGPTDLEIDHKDNDNQNNLIENLREATGSQNKANRRAFKEFSSDYNGVSYEAKRRRWKAGIRKDGQSRTIGRFKCPTAAAIAYDREAIAVFGEFAMLNFPKQERVRYGGRASY